MYTDNHRNKYLTILDLLTLMHVKSGIKSNIVEMIIPSSPEQSKQDES